MKLTWKRIVVGVVVGFIALGVIGSIANSGKSKTTQPTAVETAAPAPTYTPYPTQAPLPTLVPIEPTVAPVVPAGIIPCTDGSQDSCVVYALVVTTFSEAMPNLSIADLDCIATYISNNYTLEQVATFTDPDVQARVVGEIMRACGVQSGI
jgi:hypothetical protein